MAAPTYSELLRVFTQLAFAARFSAKQERLIACDKADKFIARAIETLYPTTSAPVLGSPGCPRTLEGSLIEPEKSNG